MRNYNENSSNYIHKDELFRIGESFFDMGFTVFPLNIKVIIKNGYYKKEVQPPIHWNSTPHDFDLYLKTIDKKRFNSLALLTRNLFVIDIDREKPKADAGTLADRPQGVGFEGYGSKPGRGYLKTPGRSGLDFLKQKNISIPKDTPFVRTPLKNGIHLYFKKPEKSSLISSGSSTKNLIDWRSDNGFIIIPPSNIGDDVVYNTGNSLIYQWGIKIKDDLSNLIYPPESLINAIIELKKQYIPKVKIKSNNNYKNAIDFNDTYGHKYLSDLSPKQKKVINNIITEMQQPKPDRSGYDMHAINMMVKYGLCKEEIYRHVHDKSKFKGRPDYFNLTYNKAVEWIKSGAYRNRKPA